MYVYTTIERGHLRGWQLIGATTNTKAGTAVSGTTDRGLRQDPRRESCHRQEVRQNAADDVDGVVNCK